MSCFTRLQKTSQLHCNFPEITGRQSIAVYFRSTDGNERRVIDCVLLQDLYCTNERGFKCEVLSSDHAVFTVPEYTGEGSGSFRCQTPGVTTSNIISCPWPPAGTGVYHSPGDSKTNSSAPTRLLLYGTASTPVSRASLDGSPFTSGVIAGVVLGSVILIVVSLAIAFLVFKRLSTHKKQKSKNDTADTEEPTADYPAYTSNASISSSKRKQLIGLFLSNDSEKDKMQWICPAQLENISVEECEEIKQPLLTTHLKEHQVWDDKDERASQRNGSCDVSPVGLDHVDQSSAERPDLEFTVEQDKTEFSGDIYKTFPLCRRLPRDSGYSSGEWEILCGSALFTFES